MDKNQVLSTLAAVDYSRFGVKSLALFGSFARGTAISQKSDVDILVEFDMTPTFDQYMELKFYLEDTLSRRVDLVERKMLHPSLRSSVESEAILVA
jgi:predicted nucleotidyltransferase